MKSLLNTVHLSGFLGMDPEIKTLENGDRFMKVSLATTEKHKLPNGFTETETMWHSLTGWNKIADYFDTHLSKGDAVIIEGKLVNRSYTDKTGIKKYITEVVVNDVVHVKRP